MGIKKKEKSREKTRTGLKGKTGERGNGKARRVKK